METEQLPLWESDSLQTQSMTDAVRYQQSLDTLQKLWFHGPTSFRGYLTKNLNKKKTSFATVLGVVRGPTRRGLQLPQSCAGVL